MSDPEAEQGCLLLALILTILLATLGAVLLPRCGGPPPTGTTGWACPDPHCCHFHPHDGGCWDYGCCDPEPVRAK